MAALRAFENLVSKEAPEGANFPFGLSVPGSAARSDHKGRIGLNPQQKSRLCLRFRALPWPRKPRFRLRASLSTNCWRKMQQNRMDLATYRTDIFAIEPARHHA
jgi:hypothetical protein